MLLCYCVVVVLACDYGVLQFCWSVVLLVCCSRACLLVCLFMYIVVVFGLVLRRCAVALLVRCVVLLR